MLLILRDARADRSLSSTLVRVMNFRLPVFTFVTCARGARNSQLIAESFFHGSAKAPSLDQQASNQGRTPRNRPNVNIDTEKSPQRQQLLVHIGDELHSARSGHTIVSRILSQG
jgi:hypothetical protein